VGEEHVDVLVVGAGPAGSVAALVLARGGARVALADKATFPRDKACGDLVGPRGLQLLFDLGVPIPDAPVVGDMVVIGPSGGRVRLPCGEGITYPGHGIAVTRTAFDAALYEAAVAAGARPLVGRADDALFDRGRLEGFRLDTGAVVRAGTVIGADGATSRVAAAAGLVDPRRVLFGFAVRTYVEGPVDLPTIVLWDRTPWHAFPGYGWAFPGVGGEANVGLGLGTLADRQRGAQAVRDLDAFLSHLRDLGLLGTGPLTPRRRLGGWLKMGMIGTVPAEGPVLLVGDAAGLVNPLQGEGIAQAMTSARSAAEAVLLDPSRAAVRYRADLAAAHLPYQRVSATAHAALLPHPRLTSGVGRLLTAPGIGRAIAGGWSIFWNGLLDGAPKSRARSLAAVASGIGRAVTAPSTTTRWFESTFPPQREPGRPARPASTSVEMTTS
jgi:geranylgeranyl reductase family protein